MVTKQQITDWAIRHGYKPDKYGHLQHSGKVNGTRRIKLQDKSFRFEVKSEPVQGAASWTRLRTGYYATVTISKDDKLQGVIR